MRVEENVPLKDFSTFKVGGPARYFCRVTSFEELRQAYLFAARKRIKVWKLGSGSNVLFDDAGFNGLVIKIELKGLLFFERRGENLVEAGAGEIWDELVEAVVAKGWWGVENLSGIPGTVGAAPVQNIGAYGSELKDTVKWVEVFDPKLGKRKVFTRTACRFGYRDSRFKHSPDDRYVITRLTLSLSQKASPNLGYQDLREYFASQAHPPSLLEIRNAVLTIRRRKLPDSDKWGNAGSFFKNPTVSVEKFAELKEHFPDLPGWCGSGGLVRISLAYIIDKILGLKGFKQGQAAIHDQQALVLVNRGAATAAEILALAELVERRVKEVTGLTIEREVLVVVSPDK
jgi:UDP-N-acetylmuramate dehydrogenase